VKLLEVGVYLDSSEILSSLIKEGIGERKLVLKHHQTVDPNARASQAVRGLFGCPSTNFSVQILILLEIVFTIAAPAFDILFIGCVLNTKIAYTTAEKLTFKAFY